ncbi:3672_t:CDS:2 [Diversispora eburnea]|uniref:3672_t:CDS:1 n=1 Tax=Diversispora eburnea TaxID=1213867 RepID=A0A9N9C0W5_9GLOM|nr:3672_t:CDS:2 [Diversispora eburnea]
MLSSSPTNNNYCFSSTYKNYVSKTGSQNKKLRILSRTSTSFSNENEGRRKLSKCLPNLWKYTNTVTSINSLDMIPKLLTKEKLSVFSLPSISTGEEIKAFAVIINFSTNISSIELLKEQLMDIDKEENVENKTHDDNDLVEEDTTVKEKEENRKPSKLFSLLQSLVAFDLLPTPNHYKTNFDRWDNCEICYTGRDRKVHVRESEKGIVKIPWKTDNE